MPGNSHRGDYSLSAPRRHLDELLRLEADLAEHCKLLAQAQAVQEIEHIHDSIKRDLLLHQEVSAECRALAVAVSDVQAAREAGESIARTLALQRDSHRLLVEARRRLLQGNGLARRRPMVPGATHRSPADSLADDITGRMAGISDDLQAQVQSSEANLGSMERSARAVASLNQKYREFSSVSADARRLVARHALKQKRDLLFMKLAVLAFVLVCVFILLKRLPLVALAARLLLRFGLMLGRKGPARQQHSAGARPTAMVPEGLNSDEL